MENQVENEPVKRDTSALFDTKPQRKMGNKAFNVLQDLFGESIIDNETIPRSRKKRRYVLLLLLFGGFIGLHRFYLGYIRYGILHILALIFSLVMLQILPDPGLGALAFIVLFLWVMADFLAIVFSDFRDRNGKLVDKW